MSRADAYGGENFLSYSHPRAAADAGEALLDGAI
jgi:hypothetical protein